MGARRMRTTFPDIPGIRSGGYSYPGTLRVGGPSQGGPPAVKMQVGFYNPMDNRQRPAGLYTVQFNVAVRGVPLPIYQFPNPTATVNFMTEGNSVQRRVSVANGMSLTGACDTVLVSVVDDTDITVFGPAPPPQDYDITISVTPYPRPSSGAPPSLRGTPGTVTVAGGATLLVPVPIDSGVNSILVFASGTGGAIPFVEQRLPGIVVPTLASWTPDNRFMPMVPQAGEVALLNLGPPASTAYYSVLFGVDG